MPNEVLIKLGCHSNYNVAFLMRDAEVGYLLAWMLIGQMLRIKRVEGIGEIFISRVFDLRGRQREKRCALDMYILVDLFYDKEMPVGNFLDLNHTGQVHLLDLRLSCVVDFRYLIHILVEEGKSLPQ
jgi:hypothetical protein